MPTHPDRQRGAILLESLVALTLLSLCAAGALAALDRLEATSLNLRQLLAEVREEGAPTQTENAR